MILGAYIALGLVTAVAFWGWFAFGPGQDSGLGYIHDAEDGAALVTFALIAGVAWPIAAVVVAVYGLGCLTLRATR